MVSHADIGRILTPYEDAFTELARRRVEHPELTKKVEEALNGDIPAYFKDTPFLYLARHVATPNFETMRFLHLVEPLNMRVIVSQDPGDKFVAHNPLKYALGRLSFCKKMTSSSNGCQEDFETLRIIDFNEAAGKPLRDVKTVWGEGFVEFHNRLFQEVCGKAEFSICDESTWMNGRFRSNALEYYRHLLPFFIAHGVMFEDYLINDMKERDFVETHILPAFDEAERTFGFRPLITSLVPTSIESGRFWLAYPHKVKEVIDGSMLTARVREVSSRHGT